MYHFSIIIPVYNEEENIVDLIYEIRDSIKKKYKYELIVVNDGSSDFSLKKINQIKDLSLKIISNKVNLGQSKSTEIGIKAAKSNTIVTIDGDGQNIPTDILKIAKLYFLNNETKLVSGIRKKRRDSIIKLISSKLANEVRSFILKDHCKDTGCSLKIFDKQIFLSFPFFDGIHRFIPAFFVRNNYKVKYVDVGHRPRLKGESKYGTKDRLTKGVIDLIRVRNILNKNV